MKPEQEEQMNVCWLKVLRELPYEPAPELIAVFLSFYRIGYIDGNQQTIKNIKAAAEKGDLQ